MAMNGFCLRRSSERGNRGFGGVREAFSLIEVVVAVGIVAVAIIPLIGLLSVGADTQREANLESRAVLVAESILANLKRSNSVSGLIVRVGSTGVPDKDF